VAVSASLYLSFSRRQTDDFKKSLQQHPTQLALVVAVEHYIYLI
jgi:hypothetical protein